MRVTVVGTGYVGLVSGTCFSEFGHHVTCVDQDAGKIATLREGRIPIFEPGLEALVARNVDAGRLDFATDLAQAVAASDAVFIAVGTPSRRGDGHADLSYVYGAAEEVADHLYGYTVVVTKSTVPVGTGSEIERRIRARRADAEFDVASNPEFLREGSAIRDFTHPDRVLVGCDDERARDVMERLYKPLGLRGGPVMLVGRESAELAKYAANAFLAMKISFINEIADLCDMTGADVQDVARAIGSDGRIGEKFLHPGPGYGGSCFPKDVAALIRTGRFYGAPVSLIEQVDQVNSSRKLAMARRVINVAGGSVADKTIGILGVTFKPETDDMREAPSLVIVPALQEGGATIRAYDPHGRSGGAEELLPGVEWAETAFDAIEQADVVVVLTEWNEFRALDLGEVQSAMRGRVLIDLRNVFGRADAEAAGLAYHAVGRPGAMEADPVPVTQLAVGGG